MYNFFKPEAELSNMQLVLKNDLPKEDDVIKTDELKLNSILINLIKNAIKYSHDGLITIGCCREKQDIIFSIADSGIGIEESRREAIFDRFVQADIEDRAAYEGSGLGLAITKSYVEMLGGKIWVESELGKGSTFHVSITQPKTIHKVVPQKEKPTPDEGVKSKLINILVAEDEVVSTMLIESMLEDEDYKILYAENGKQALEIFNSDAEIDIILMDLKMPVMSGFEATQRIREIDQDIPIIAQSAYAFTDDRKKAIASGCTDFIAKPLDQKELIAKINTYTRT
jgi:CheY-like chemotaxis protein/anti-sigma regulatory factor (Ser/Thr protein kinase)